ncbi:ABC transporter permease [Melioribacteraceae bacterium 4301-Me]|uniref:ABC transporter permease n=1 Tax=Pyranulibacter aquaticus TaxID=3163344 RepID=UPI00359902D0
MKERIKNIITVFKREIKVISKDVNLIAVLLLAPIFYSFFYSSIYSNKTEENVRIVVVDMDNSSITKELIRNFDAHQKIKVYEVVSDFSNGVKEINTGNAQAMIFFPKNFEKNLKSGKGADLKLYLNSSRFLVSNDINKAINETIAYAGAEIRLKYFLSNSYSYEQAKELIEPIHGEIHPMFSFTETYGDFLIPAILILIIHQTLLIGLSESIAKERELGTLSELFYLTKGNVTDAIHGKGLFYFILYLSYSLFFLTINFKVFSINILGSWFALSLTVVLLIASVIYISIFISSFFKKKIISLQFLTLTSYPVFLISGYSWPIQSMPIYIKVIAYLIPITPFYNAYIRIIRMGASFSDVYLQVIHLLALTILGFAVASIRMKTLFSNVR